MASAPIIPPADQDQPSGTAIATLENIDDICAGRDKAIELWMQLHRQTHEGLNAAGMASIAGFIGLKGQLNVYSHRDSSHDAFFKFGMVKEWEGEGWARNQVDRDAAELFRDEITTTIDRRCWENMMERLGFDDLLDAQARKEFAESLIGKPPPFTADNCRATFQHVWGQRREMYLRGIANVFMGLCRSFRSHDAFAIGKRIIFDRALSIDYGSWSDRRKEEALNDVERIFRELENLPPLGYSQRIGEHHCFKYGQRGVRIEAAYFKIDTFKNGNVHLWFTRKDLLAEVNKLLLEYYKPVEGDVAEGPSYEAGPLFHQTPAKHYGFFPSPQPVVDEVIRLAGLYERPAPGSRGAEHWEQRSILEPSAGTGALAKAARAYGHQVTTIEVQPHLAALLRSEQFTCKEADFLQVEPEQFGQFDTIIMNPPFDRGRDCDHVRHAYTFLKPGGVLVAVMSARAEFATDKRHAALHAIVNANRNQWGGGANGEWHDLPERSFAESGTNVNTVVLRLRKPRN